MNIINNIERNKNVGQEKKQSQNKTIRIIMRYLFREKHFYIRDYPFHNMLDLH